LCRTRRPSSSRPASSGRPSTRSDEKPRRGRTPASPPSSFSRFRHACRVGWEGEVPARVDQCLEHDEWKVQRRCRSRVVARDEGREPSSPRRSCMSVGIRTSFLGTSGNGLRSRPAWCWIPSSSLPTSPFPCSTCPCRFHPRCPVAEERCSTVDSELRPIARSSAHHAARVLVPGYEE
jgi:hypothetical protein